MGTKKNVHYFYMLYYNIYNITRLGEIDCNIKVENFLN